MSLSRKAAVTGFAEMAPQRRADGHTPLSIIGEMARAAVADAGLEKDDIDGLLVGSCVSDYVMYWSLAVADYLHLDTHFLNQYSMPTGMLWRAVAAIEAGLCRNVLVVAADTWDSKALARKGPPPFPRMGDEFNFPYGLFGAAPGYALIARRHMHEYGTTAEQLAKIAVDQRRSACRNPAALFGDREISIDEVLASRLICDPVHLLEVVSPCTGGGAFVVSRADIARAGPNRPVYLLGAGEAGGHWGVTHAPSMTTSAVKEAAQRAYAMAGVTPQQMDFAQLYDCFTIVVLISLEDAGFCAKGEGGPFVESTDLSWAGPLPVNTHGGQLSFGQPGIGGGLSQVIEGIRQLMGRGGARQVPHASLGLVNNNGDIMAKQCCLVLGLE